MSKKYFIDKDYYISLIKNPNIKVISFDIFDTLLQRVTLLPTDVIYFLNQKAVSILNDSSIDFYHIRCIAESETRKLLEKENKNYGEVNIYQIYQYIQISNHIEKDKIDKLICAEIECENQLIQSRLIGKELFDIAIASGKRVILASDMYLGKEILEKILILKGFSGFGEIYVSSDYKMRKDNGRLFEFILQKEYIKESELLHIGDNPDSDVRIPLNLGITSFHLPSSKDIFFSYNSLNLQIWKDYKNFKPSTRLLLGVCVNKLVENLINDYSENSVFSSKYLMGFYGLGPLLFTIVSKILSSQKLQMQYSAIHFASRDGYLPQKAYNFLRNNDINKLDSKYIYCGRLAYDIAWYENNIFEYLTRQNNYTNDYTLNDLFNSLIENNFLSNKYSNSDIGNLLYIYDKKSGFKVIKQIIKDYGKIIDTILIRRRILARQYYQSAISFNNNRAVFFDIGYSGSVSSSIGKITDKFIDKIYLWQTEKNEYYDRINRTTTNLLIGNHFSNTNFPHIDLVLEELFSPLEHSCIGFAKNEEGIIEPVFSEESSFSKEMLNDLNQIQKGAIDFVTTTNSILRDYNILSDITEINPFIELLMTVFASPTDRSIRFLENIKFPDRFTRNGVDSLAKKVDESNFFFFHRTNYLDKQLIKTSQSNSDVKLKIAIHLHLYHFEQSYEIIEKLKDAPYKFDLLISIVNKSNYKIVEAIFNPVIIPNLNRVIIKVLPNRGRDVAPLVVGFREEQFEYDIVCHIHTKKSVHFTWGNDWRKYLFDNLISSDSIRDITKLFSDNKDLGVVFPPIFEGILNFWTTNSLSHLGLFNLLDLCGLLLKKMGINEDLDRNNVFFSVGNMFWYRPEAISPLFNLGLRYSDFPEEPIQVDGTISHAIERLHSIIAKNRGFKTFCYISPTYLIDNFFEHSLLNISLENHSKNKAKLLGPLYNKIVAEKIDNHINSDEFLEAMIISLTILSIDQNDELAQNRISLLGNRVIENIKKDNWNEDKGKLLLKEAVSQILKGKLSDARQSIKILCLYEPINLIALNLLTFINIKELNIDFAIEINKIALAINPKDKDAISYYSVLHNKTFDNTNINAKFDNLKLPDTVLNINIDEIRSAEFTSSGENPVFSIIIPVHNKWELTKECIASIEKNKNNNKVEIIVVNNGSSDMSGALLKSMGNKIKVISNSSNETYAKANNQGANLAKGKFLIFLNNDTKVFPGWIDEIERTFDSDSEIGVQGAKLLYENGKIQHAGMVFGKMQQREAAPYHAYLMAPEDAPFVNHKRNVQFVTGALLAIRKEIFDFVKGFDENYVFGWEDTDLCMKVNELGKKIVYNPSVKAYHFESATKQFKTSQGEDMLNPNNEKEIKNRLYFFSKWHTKLKADADEFYAEDGIKLENGSYIYMTKEEILQIKQEKNNSIRFMRTLDTFKF